MLAKEQLLDDLAGAILDGTAVDWTAVESRADDRARPLVRQLQLVASVARVHRDLLPGESDVPPDPGGTLAPDYWGYLRIVERIGRGAFGEVFRAWDTRLDREVALKLLPASPAASGTESSIIREGRLLARVRHPNVVTIYGAEQIGDRIGLWMEFVQGRSLEQVLRQETTFSAGTVVDIGIELCGAVQAVHAAGLLHRDIKAHNVVQADDGRVVLMDFGTGRELDDTSSSDLAGTPLYLAPEVLNGGPATVQSDIYSVGVLLHHLITGSYPVRGGTIREVRRAHEDGQRVGIRSAAPLLRPAVARIIERATHPKPERRYQSVEGLAGELSAVRIRPGRVHWRYAAAIAAAALGALLMLEAHARITGDHGRAPTRLAGLTGSLLPLGPVKIAVLPFTNIGAERDTELAARITFSLIGRLGSVDGLRVRGLNLSVTQAQPSRNLASVGPLPDVTHLVRGDVRASEGRLRVRASLADGAGGRTLWAEEITGPLASGPDDVKAIEELTTTLVRQLLLKLGHPAPGTYAATDVDTFRKYVKARELLDGRGPRAHEAIPLYEEVLRAYPNHAPALAELAATYGYLGMFYPDANATYMRPAEAMVKMEPLVRQALDVDPFLAEAHSAKGVFNAFGLRWSEAEAAFKRAIELNPTSIHLYGDFVLSTLQPLGKLDEAIRVMNTALDMDPQSLDARRVLSNIQLHAGLFPEALDNCERVLRVDPDFPYAGQYCIWARLFIGQRAQALAQLELVQARLIGVRGWVHAIKGERAQAEAIATQFGHLPQRQAEIYGLMGDTDRAIAALEQLALMNPGRAGYQLTHPAVGLQGDKRAVEFRRRNLRFSQ